LIGYQTFQYLGEIKSNVMFICALIILSWICIHGVGGTSAPSAAPTSNTLQNGLILYLPFNGNALDYGSESHTITVNGATKVNNRFGNSNAAYHFVANNYMNISASA
jgi:hypothetical protein